MDTCMYVYLSYVFIYAFQSPAAPAPNTAEPPQNTIKSQLKRAIKALAIDEALKYLPQYVI